MQPRYVGMSYLPNFIYPMLMYWPTYLILFTLCLCIDLPNYLNRFLFLFLFLKIQLIFHMKKTNYTTNHNLRPYKMNNHNGWWRSIFQKYIFSPKNPHSAMCQFFYGLMKIMSTWRYHCIYKLVALKLHNLFLHEFHMYLGFTSSHY
jgi:hypothetical protein